MSLKPRRSVLYLPASNQRALQKARELDVDCLIFDLEDAVLPERKEAARAQLVDALRAGGYGERERIVRINGLDTPWGEKDLQTFTGADAHGLLLPKVETPEQVRDAAVAMDEADAPESLKLWVMAETAKGVLAMDAIAGAADRLAVIVMGTSDLARELRVPNTLGREGLIAALQHCVLAARAHCLEIVDGVYIDLEDDAGFEQSCRQGRALGFDGKSLIHPRQLPAANQVFAPSAEAQQHARRLIEGWEAARARGDAVVIVDGQLVENLHVEEAQRTLALADAIRRRAGVESPPT